MQNPNNERRAQGRRYPRSQRAAWAFGPGEPLRMVDVADVSESGIGLRFAGCDAPLAGEAIRVVSRYHPMPHKAEVIRVQPSSDGSVSIGCRWMQSATRRAPRPARRRAPAAGMPPQEIPDAAANL
ncbi:MAG: PilZ domain-containing protein [Phycisphaerales bacterium]|nr:PilZ domain-containing protein [Phycisphaerales bacterium]